MNLDSDVEMNFRRKKLFGIVMFRERNGQMPRRKK